MTVAGSLGSARAGVPVAVARQPILDRAGDFEACESYGVDLLVVAEVYRAALAWVEQTAPHLA
jgi:hypothetical protein